jgi:1,4-alpha-glucan branching enzyme
MAKTVCLAGTFNDWHPRVSEMLRTEDGLWLKDLSLPAGTYEYRFVVDGIRVTDPKCCDSVANPYGQQNSLIVVNKTRPLAKVASGLGGLRKRQTFTNHQLQVNYEHKEE